MNPKKKALFLIMCLCLLGCTVPVFRYALERWAPDPHRVLVAGRLNLPFQNLNKHHSNLWVERGPEDQKSEVRILYPNSDVAWYEGPWEQGLLDRISDSPLRRQIAKELLSGSTAVWILIEGEDPKLNEAKFQELNQTLKALAKQIVLPEQPDYEDVKDGFSTTPGSLSAIPLHVAFSQHRVSRKDKKEAFLIKQFLGVDPKHEKAKGPLVAVVFGQGRMLVVPEEEANPQTYQDISGFLCSECSCRVKTINPGVDLLMTANWEESVYWFPKSMPSILPSGDIFTLFEDQGEVDHIKMSGIQGGLAVFLDFGKWPEGKTANKGFIFQGLSSSEEQVIRARKLGLAPGVTFALYNGTSLPYGENTVNLIVAFRKPTVSKEELLRVLVPNGKALIPENGGWKTVVKPWPEKMDEWTHFLHDGDNNAVSKDPGVGPPRRFKWNAGPKWARSHEHLSSISACVSANGRIFYIADEGPCASVLLPSKWVLTARDAFNGVLLWKRPIDDWEDRLRPFRSGPNTLQRRLVARENKVYVTLGYNQPVKGLDAATGETLLAFPRSETTHEMVCLGQTLYLVLSDPEKKMTQEEADRLNLSRKAKGLVTTENKWLMALHKDTGKILWTKNDKHTHQIMPLTLAVSQDKLCFQNTRELICLDRNTGEENWRTDYPLKTRFRKGSDAPTLTLHQDVVLSADQCPPDENKNEPENVIWNVTLNGGGKKGRLKAFSLIDGKKLWETDCSEGYNSPVDVFVIDNRVWTGEIINKKDKGFTRVYDLHTGEVVEEFPVDTHFQKVGMPHHRCYRNKATPRYILSGRSGIEFVDMENSQAELHNWVRGSCQYGVMPANGLVYAPPHSCACYLNAKLDSFNALAPKGEQGNTQGPRLKSGAAIPFKPWIPEEDEWPTYRQGANRYGAVKGKIPNDPILIWSAAFSQKLTSPVIARGKVFVAEKESHTLYALDACNGKILWSFTAGGRVDSPPTLHGNYLLLGCADGMVYALDSETGAWVWRFRAAPQERMVVSYNQVESAWPVHGNILVRQDQAFFAAGRSSFLDGGIRLFRLDAATGQLQVELCVNHFDPETGKQPPVKGFEMEGALPDILSFDGTHICMRHLRFDPKTLAPADKGPHLFTPTGFLDDSWWHRTYWIFGDHFKAGWGGWWRVGNQIPSGRILCLEQDRIFGFGRTQLPKGNAGQWGTGETYHLFSALKKNETIYSWTKTPLVNARAMVLTDTTLYYAGPKGDINHNEKAFQGKEGCALIGVSKETGEKQVEIPLPASPVFDGMAAAKGRLFLCLEDGRMICLGK